jgi:hypothetical protein
MPPLTACAAPRTQQSVVGGGLAYHLIGGFMKRFALLAAGLTLLLVAAAPKLDDDKDKDKDKPLPGHDKIACNTKLLEVPGAGLWKIVKTDYDSDKRTARWVLEAQKDIGEAEYQAQEEAWGVFPVAYFFDDDKVRIARVTVQLEGDELRYKKGERIRVVLMLPDEETMKRVIAVEIRSGK